ncbi:MAG TPA: isopentenyl-diphosphate Delta-isomerase [Thermoplasmata archaeon]|nr:isopentenyl-diphosphate Delta-isomerase [Thermoplasmata archaeon]
MINSEADERVVLVDGEDREVGTARKMDAHRNGGRLHRAFSILVFDAQGRTLLQKRAAGKYHAAGQWTNTCCSHPRPGETVEAAAHRKLKQELGFDCPLVESFPFTYSIDLGGGMSEREFDHVLFGQFNGTPTPNPEEVEAFRWASLAELMEDVRIHSREYTPWFKIILLQLSHAPVPLPGYVRAPSPTA